MPTHTLQITSRQPVTIINEERVYWGPCANVPKPSKEAIERAREIVQEYYCIPDDGGEVPFEKIPDCVSKSLMKDIAEAVAEAEALTIPGFEISKYPGRDSFWFQKADNGEGMEVSIETMEKIFKEHM